MGTLSNLFDVVRIAGSREIENEASREITIGLAGNTPDARDKLHRALSTRLESLWTPSPFHLIESNERPTGRDDSSAAGLLIYVLTQGDQIPTEKQRWLEEVAKVTGLAVILVVLDRNTDKVFNRNERNRVSQRLQALNPLRLVGGRELATPAPSAAADGAAFTNANVSTKPAWQNDLTALVDGAGGKISLVGLDGLDLNRLQAELLPLIVEKLPNRELALARRAPIFRNTVASILIKKTARANAEMVLLANAASGVPLLSGFFDSGADFVGLTKNQFELSSRLAEVYGQKRDSRVEVYLELAPIVGMAFLWKNISGLATTRLPRLLAVIPKVGIAFGATLLVGWAAQLYYSTGRKAPGQLAAFVRGLVERVSGQKSDPAAGNSGDNPRQLRSS